ncbi:hypothetical protein AAVH_11450 [Aphelenchoides avenae]|nr:hypothetical protein AAVH_11450 [Aphelenchus avenae]
MFVVAELDGLWQWYRDARVPRHFYEVIQEVRPCRPYFDLEFAKDFNPGLDPGEALRGFLDPAFAKHPRRTTPKPQPRAVLDAAPSKDSLGDVHSQPARIKREVQSDSDIEGSDVNPDSNRRGAQVAIYSRPPSTLKGR